MNQTLTQILICGANDIYIYTYADQKVLPAYPKTHTKHISFAKQINHQDTNQSSSMLPTIIATQYIGYLRLYY